MIEFMIDNALTIAYSVGGVCAVMAVIIIWTVCTYDENEGLTHKDN